MALHLGEADLAADLNITPGPDETELLYARSQVVVASRAGNLAAPIAPVAVDLADRQRFQATTLALKRLGFIGRACIHPTQVQLANEAFTPTPQEIAWATEVLELLATPGTGVATDSAGTMIDEAVLRRARRIHHQGGT